MSLKKIEKLQNALFIRFYPINANSQKIPAECRMQVYLVSCLAESGIPVTESAGSVKATIPSQLANQMFYQDKLDNIGRAICIDEDFLDRVRLIKVTQVRRK